MQSAMPIDTKPLARSRRGGARFGRVPALAALLALLLLAGCLKRVDAPLPTTTRRGALAANWDYAGSFGGDAVRQVDSSDPWEVRFRPGGFVDVAGLCVANDEVWVCDLGISRLQVFGFDGSFKRQYGAGVPIDGTLLSPAELYIEERDYDYHAKVKAPRWEDGPGRPWVYDRVNLFKAADVVVLKDGYVIADQARTGAEAKPRRRDAVALIRWDGSRQEFGATMLWPAYLANQGNSLAISLSPGNALYLTEVTSETWPQQRIGADISFNGLMELLVDHKDMANFELAYDMATKAGMKARDFNGLGGAAVAFDKVVACDTGNRFLKVFEDRREDASKWGALIRLIPARKRDGGVRFVAPRTIAIDGNGTCYVLDLNPQRIEVAVLDPAFDRIGSFGAGQLVTPYDLAVSADGHDCFVTDRSNNQVHHYVRGE